MDLTLSYFFEAAVLLIALVLALKPRIEFLTFRRALRRRKYRVGFWIQTDDDGTKLKTAVAEALRQQGLEPFALHDQAASELYRNTHWRERIAACDGQRVDVVVVGRQRIRATNDIGSPYQAILDFRYFYPQNGAPLNTRGLPPYVSGPAGAVEALAAKVGGEIVRALWLMKSRPAPPAPAYPFDTSSWPFTLNMELNPQEDPSSRPSKGAPDSMERTESSHPRAALHMAIALPVTAVLIAGACDFGNSFFVYNRLEDRIRAGARYAASRAYDANHPDAYVNAVRNVVVYGNPDGGAAPVDARLSPGNVVVGFRPLNVEKTPPREITVSISEFHVGVMKSITLLNQPKAQAVFAGAYTAKR